MQEPLMDECMNKLAFVPSVRKFAELYDARQFTPGQKRYRELLPPQIPGAGQQYAFEVDLDKCTGCKACVTACHNENGLDEDETWRSVGLLLGVTDSHPVIQHVTSACHHCVEPACLHGCPTKAYEKDPVTGIVKHLEDQCFGCQYCILRCPYDVPKYNKKRGIVHKCDMCAARLKAGQAPACARACPTGAIRITVVDLEDVKRNPSQYVNVPDAPASGYTYPTTKYKTKRRLPASMVSVDHEAVRPEHSHFPLVLMLVFTQLSAGAFLAEWVLRYFMKASLNHFVLLMHALMAMSLGVLALASSLLHLGRPRYAFRAVLGLKTSWLSREILAFGLFSGLAVLYALSLWFSSLENFVTGLLGPQALDLLAACVSLSGLAGVFCSVMAYRDTKRPFWDNHSTALKFFLTTGILGFAALLSILLIPSSIQPGIFHSSLLKSFAQHSCIAILILTFIKLILEAAIFLYLYKGGSSFLKKTALLMARELKPYTLWRFGCGFTGGILIPFLYLNIFQEINAVMTLVLSLFILFFSLTGELLERYLFFRAVVPLRMPRGNAH